MLEEFESYFSGLVGDVERNNEKYAAAMRQLEQLLQLEHETELIRRKVAAFTLDYDDDLVIIITNFVSICQFVFELLVFFLREQSIGRLVAKLEGYGWLS